MAPRGQFFRKNGAIKVHQVQGEYIVHDLTGKQIHILNEAAYALLELCTGENSVETICATLKKDYYCSAPTTMEELVSNNLALFMELGVIETAPNDAAHSRSKMYLAELEQEKDKDDGE